MARNDRFETAVVSEARIGRLLRQASDAIAAGDLADALRCADAAARRAPSRQTFELLDQLAADLHVRSAAAAIRRRFDVRDREEKAAVGLDRAAAEARIEADPRPSAVLVTHSLGGGVARFVGARRARLEADGMRVLVLKPGATAGVVAEAGAGPRLAYGADDTTALADFLRRARVAQSEIHHFVGLDERVIDVVQALDARCCVYIHDYAWLCTRITMVAPHGHFCSEPALPACSACGLANGALLEPGLSIPDLRARSARWLGRAHEVVVSSCDVQQRMLRYFPDVRTVRRPFEEPSAQPAAAPIHRAGRRLRVAMIGAIADDKGYQVLLACAEDARLRDLDLEFVVIGFTLDDEPLFDTGRVFVTGEYAEGELDALLAREAPDAALFASVWPETWCYSLSGALAAALPVLAFDIGALPERLAACGSVYRLMSPSSTAGEINDQLLQLGNGGGICDDLALARGNYFNEKTFQHIAHQPPPMDTDIPALNVTGRIVPLPKGLYQVSVTSAAPASIGEEGDVMLPAVHVGPAPGMPPDRFEVMTGLQNRGAWVFARRDVLILKIKATPTSVLMISVSAPGAPHLDVAIERIDNRVPGSPERPSLPGPAPRSAPPPAIAASAPPEPASPAPDRPRDRTPALPAALPDRDDRRRLRMQVLTHVRNKGDVKSDEGDWAGAPADQLAIEGFAITPLEGLTLEQIEYKGLTETGVETPWMGGGALCGARGARTALVGFAVRIAPGASAGLDCEYRGLFQSGAVVGPLTGGAPCMSSNPGDLLEGIELGLYAKPGPSEAAAPPPAARRARAPNAPPRFSLFREEPAS